jgi:carbonic anhydrase
MFEVIMKIEPSTKIAHDHQGSVYSKKFKTQKECSSWVHRIAEQQHLRETQYSYTIKDLDPVHLPSETEIEGGVKPMNPHVLPFVPKRHSMGTAYHAFTAPK